MPLTALHSSLTVREDCVQVAIGDAFVTFDSIAALGEFDDVHFAVSSVTLGHNRIIDLAVEPE